ncbi:MAG: TIGR02281 family clan AA aspartic protease [Hyphomicrobium sp.]|jgi:aspartyl protease family protein
MLGWLLLILAALVGLFVFLSGDTEAVKSLGFGQLAYMIAFAMLALLLITRVSGDYNGRAWTGLRHAMVWVIVAAALVAGYSYRGELTAVAYRVAGEVLPPGQVLTIEPTVTGERAVRLRRHPGGHFIARGAVNGTALPLLIDTGASTVVLKPADAERAGIDTEGLSFTVPVSTANGTAYAAPVRLKAVSIGPIELRDVEALVAQPGTLSENLLGMSFLKRLHSYEFSGDFLTLRG